MKNGFPNSRLIYYIKYTVRLSSVLCFAKKVKEIVKSFFTMNRLWHEVHWAKKFKKWVHKFYRFFLQFICNGRTKFEALLCMKRVHTSYSTQLIWRNFCENTGESTYYIPVHNVCVCGNNGNALTDSLVTSLIRTFFSRNFCQKCLRINFRNFYTVLRSTMWKNEKSTATQNFSREINFRVKFFSKKSFFDEIVASKSWQ